MLKVALAGLGTVGSGVVRMLRQNAVLISARAGRPIVIKAVSARDRSNRRDCDLSGIDWVDDPRQLSARPDVDVVVELIGGSKGVASEVGELALKNGKHLVTANKALLALQGASLARLAETVRCQLSFEAAVAGGIPIIKTMREVLAGNRVSSVRGILNGTCNHILTRMYQDDLPLAEALLEAQQRGYAEADPSGDIDGCDTADKLAILSALAFGIEPDVASISVEGIRRITPQDLDFADELGCRIKLLGVARMSEKGLERRVGPALVPKTSPLAHVAGALNAVLIHGDFIGDMMLEGQGAGSAPTASAVVSDLIDLARGHMVPAFGQPAALIEKCSSAPVNSMARSYMRLMVVDKPGVVADISVILRDEAISVESMIQRGVSQSGSVPVVLTMHAAPADAMRRAAEKIAKVSAVREPPCLMPIED